MRKRNLLVIISIIVIGLVILGIYETFASSNTVSGSDNAYSITLTGNGSEISVPAGESKTVIYQITNTNKGTVQYGVTYSGTNIEVKVYEDSSDKVTGNIDYGETKFIKLLITNKGTTTSTASINGVVGYEKGGELDNIVSSGFTLTNKAYTPLSGFALYITNLFFDNKDTTPVVNNNVSYMYASIYDKDSDNSSSGGLMNDRLGSMSIYEDIGNIRYYGYNPSNYIYFNCSDYSNQSSSTCELWRIIGVFDGKVKIMRNEGIGYLAWDQDKNQNSNLNTYNNDWSTSSLQELLNGKYYNRGTTKTITYYSLKDGSSSVDINLESIGIKDNTRKLISETLWYLKGWDNSETYSDQMYNYERNNGKVYNAKHPVELLKHIGLPYLSDYGYATDMKSCSLILDYYSASACKSKNWMKSIFNSNTLLMAPNSSNSNLALFVNSAGNVYNGNYVYHADGVAPVLHLNSELGIKTGDGSQDTPYQIAIG